MRTDMFDNILNKYELKGSFSLQQHEELANKCNAPKDKSGIYLIYKVNDNQETLIYIGSSGQRDINGNLKHRKGGMYDRIVNGYHPNRFGAEKREKRKKTFPNQMKKQNIPEITIYWWITYYDKVKDFPSDIEKQLRDNYKSIYGILPEWHQQK